MNQEKLESFRQLLLKERLKIVSNANRTTSGELELSSDDMADENDMASALYDQSFTLRMRDRERMLMTKIGKVLRLIEEGDYGYCIVCDDDIAIGRLEARPVTTMCIDCKEESERNERAYASFAPERPLRIPSAGAGGDTVPDLSKIGELDLISDDLDSTVDDTDSAQEGALD